jgi:hypothetical protein
MSVTRACIRCGAEITLCHGFVLARDTLAAQDGRIPWASVREHCGKCGLWALLHPRLARKWLMSLSFP